MTEKEDWKEDNTEDCDLRLENDKEDEDVIQSHQTTIRDRVYQAKIKEEK